MRNDLTQFVISLAVLGLIATVLGILAAGLLIVNDAIRGYLRARAAEQRLIDLRARNEYARAEADSDLFDHPWPTLDAEPPTVFPRRRAA